MAVRSRLKIVIAQRNLERVKCNQPLLTLRHIAEETALAVSTVNGLTSQRATMVNFATLDKLCAYFKVQPGDLLEYVPEENESAPTPTNP